MTVGSAKGSITELFKKVQAIDSKHGKFEIVLCVGDFFGAADGEKQKETEQLLAGEIKGTWIHIVLRFLGVLTVNDSQHPYRATSCKETNLYHK